MERQARIGRMRSHFDNGRAASTWLGWAAMDVADAYYAELVGPLDALPARGQMRAANLQGFGDLVRHLGGDPAWILERHGIDPRAIVDPDHHVACQSVVDIFQYCATRFEEPLFGLHLALRQEPDVYGCVAALCRAAPDMRTAVRKFMAYLPLVHSPEAEVELAEDGEEAELRWGTTGDLGYNRQALLQALVLNLKLLRMIGGATFQPERIVTTCEMEAGEAREAKHLLGVPAAPSAGRNAIVFASTWLDRPVSSANRLLFRLLDGYLTRLRMTHRESTPARVESYVRGALPSGHCSIERCAEKLGLTARTLQLRLQRHGTGFAELVEKQRLQLARVYLAQSPMALDEVAERLGYSDQTSFGRAFRRWTGTTPQRYRAGH